MSAFPAFAHVTFSIYRCLDCNDKRAVTCIPAVIDGVVSDAPSVAEDCSQCRSTNIKTLFETKDADEFAVYCQIINLEDEVENE